MNGAGKAKRERRRTVAKDDKRKGENEGTRRGERWGGSKTQPRKRGVRPGPKSVEFACWGGPPQVKSHMMGRVTTKI